MKSLNLKKILNGLYKFRKEYKGKLWLEIMLVDGINDSKKEFKEIRRNLESIKPDRIYLNFPIRPPAETWVKIPDKQVLKIAEEILGDVFEITYEELGEFSIERLTNPIEAIENIIRRHPMREEQIYQILDKYPKKHLEEALNELIKSNQVMINRYRGTTFYRGLGKGSRQLPTFKKKQKK